MTLKHLDEVSHDDELFYRELSREKAARDRFVIEMERREETEARGMAKGKAQVAVQMLREGCAYSLISKVTGLSKAKINKAEGEAKASHAIAANMLKEGCLDSFIARMTGLSETEVRSLKAKTTLQVQD